MQNEAKKFERKLDRRIKEMHVVDSDLAIEVELKNLRFKVKYLSDKVLKEKDLVSNLRE